jgi:hypothetical protein
LKVLAWWTASEKSLSLFCQHNQAPPCTSRLAKGRTLNYDLLADKLVEILYGLLLLPKNNQGMKQQE